MESERKRDAVSKVSIGFWTSAFVCEKVCLFEFEEFLLEIVAVGARDTAGCRAVRARAWTRVIRVSDVRAPPLVALVSIATHLARQGVQTMAFRQGQMYAFLLELFQLRSPVVDRQPQLLQDSCQSLTRQSQQWN